MGIYLSIVLCLLASFSMLLYAAKRLIETLVFIRAANRTGGKVVALANARTGDRQLTYLSIFEYCPEDGRRFQYVSTIASNPPAYEIGAAAELLYLKKNPQKVKINSFSELWLVTLILALIGGAFSGGALLIFSYH